MAASPIAKVRTIVYYTLPQQLRAIETIQVKPKIALQRVQGPLLHTIPVSDLACNISPTYSYSTDLTLTIDERKPRGLGPLALTVYINIFISLNQLKDN